MRLIFIICLSLFFRFSIFGENPCSVMYPYSTGDWGKGVIWIPKNTDFNFSLQKDSNIDGYMCRNQYYRHDIEYMKEPFDYSNSQEDVVSIGSSNFNFIKVYEITDDGFLKIFNQSTRKGYWVNIGELKNRGILFFNYEEILFGKKSNLPKEILNVKKQTNIGVNLVESCLNLRELPQINSSKIDCCASNGWSKGTRHLIILERKGQWAKVEVTYLLPEIIEGSMSDCDNIEDKKIIAWVKAIDDNGFPNIWFSVSGY